jgi:arsenite methyltransferase
MVAVLGFSKDEIRQAVTDMYSLVADNPDSPQHFPIGRDASLLVGYPALQVDQLPRAVIESFAGVGFPFRAGVIQPGHTVLDIGSGSGTDVMLASKLVGDSGKVWAMDVTAAMREKLAANLEQAAVSNVEIIPGDAEKIPLADASVDVVTSNGVLNLVIDKRAAIAEIFRVLKPGGRAQIADIVIASPVTPDCKDDPALWAECVVGATIDENYLEMFRDAGFDDVEVLRDYDYFTHSPSAETREIARQFGAHAFELGMRRGAHAPAKAVQLAKRMDPRRLARSIQQRGLWGTVALVMAMLSCYGSLALLGLFSLFGMSVALNETIWAGSIILFAVIATLVIALGMRRHGSPKALILALIGTAILVYTMYIDYSKLIEAVGFVCLAIASYLDFDLRRWARVKGGNKRVRHARKAVGSKSANL